jgi:hypothetical protein
MLYDKMESVHYHLHVVHHVLAQTAEKCGP